MLLIALAITVAFLASMGASLGVLDHQLDFWWELALLIVIMLLGHWIEMRSLAQTTSALDSLAALLPDTAERVDGDDVVENVVGAQGDHFGNDIGYVWIGLLNSDQTWKGGQKIGSGFGGSVRAVTAPTQAAVEVYQERRGKAERDAIDHEVEQSEGQHGERECQQDQNRPDDGVGKTQHERRDRQGTKGVDLHTGQHPGRRTERDGGGEPVRKKPTPPGSSTPGASLRDGSSACLTAYISAMPPSP